MRREVLVDDVPQVVLEAIGDAVERRAVRVGEDRPEEREADQGPDVGRERRRLIDQRVVDRLHRHSRDQDRGHERQERRCERAVEPRLVREEQGQHAPPPPLVRLSTRMRARRPRAGNDAQRLVGRPVFDRNRHVRLAAAWRAASSALPHNPSPSTAARVSSSSRWTASSPSRSATAASGAIERAPPRRREPVVHLAPVGVVALALDEALRDEAVDNHGDRGPAHRKRPRERRGAGGSLGQEDHDPVLREAEIDRVEGQLDLLGQPRCGVGRVFPVHAGDLSSFDGHIIRLQKLSPRRTPHFLRYRGRPS